MANIPGKKVPKFYEKKWIVELLSIVPPIIAALYVANGASLNTSTAPYAPWLWAGIGWLTVASLIKVVHAYQQDKEEKLKHDHDGLSAALHVLHGSLASHSKLSEKNDGTLRVTIHRVVPPIETPEQLEQLVPYIGGQGGSAGRIFSIRSGVAGLVARDGEVYFYARTNDDYEAYVAEMTKNWGFTEADARRLQADRMAWMAVPIFARRNDAVVAVVFLDTKLKDLFNANTKALAINCCGGIAAYITERYQL